MRMPIANLLVVALVMAPLAAPAADTDPYVVSPLAIAIGQERVGDQLLRWVRYSSESEYPCLRVELLATPALELLERQEICTLPGANGQPLDLRYDVARVDFADLAIINGRVRFAAELMPLDGSTLNWYCEVKLADGHLQPLRCLPPLQ
ncbi:MAG: hypothetical protein II007_02880 [Gammaproteobacteria bacterium]|nr:hypothetical protein [Gammaproteobacteria bacterium]